MRLLWVPVLWILVVAAGPVPPLRADSAAKLTLSGYVNNEMPSWLRINASIQPSSWAAMLGYSF